MSNFLIFKAAFNNSATPAIGTYTAEGATARFNMNPSLSPDYYLYNTADDTAVQWFVPTAETTDFEFVADILTRYWNNRVTYFIIADSTGTTRLRMWSQYDNWEFENSDSISGSGDPEYIGTVSPTTSGGFGVFHQFRVRVRKLTASSSSVEVYVDGTLKLTATTGAALITCAKIGFVGGVSTRGPGTGAGIKNAYVYDLSGGEVIDRGVLSGAFNRFISWMKSKFALKSDIPTVNDGTLTIQKNGTNVATFTANQSTAATANITVPTAMSELTNDSGYLTASSNLDASKLTSGTVDIARLPQGALERLVKVANEAARYALTTADVQLGDTVQQLDTGIMYVVTDTDHLDSAAGYTEYTAGTAASVPWSGVTGKPTFAAVATSGAYSDLTGTPALAAVATSGAYSDLTGTPTIPTVNNATLTIQKNGVNVQTFTANASTNATANITVPTKTSDLTNDSGFITSDNTKIPLSGSNAISGSLIPATDNSIDIGSSTNNIKALYTKGITINGTQFLPSDYVPRSGGAVMTGTSLFKTNTNSGLQLGGGTSESDGGSINLVGDNGYFAGDVVVRATKPNESECVYFFRNTAFFTLTSPTLGNSTYKWGQIYSTNSTISTSDSRLKNSVKDIDDRLLDAWGNIEPKQYKFNDATEKKGEKARLHTGYIAQDIQAECEKQGVNASDYGLFCYDEWNEQEEVSEEIETEKDGKKVKEKRVIQPKREKGNMYALRYEEALVVECKYLRRCIKQLTARIEELEKGKEQGASK